MVWVTPTIDRRRFTHHQVHKAFHDMYVTRGYRKPNSSFIECLDSLFHFDNNEMMNFWTHFIPLIWLFTKIYSITEMIDFANDPRTGPLIVYLLSISFLLFSSSMAHAFNSMSEFKRHICFMIDYLSLSILSFGVAIGYRSFMAFPQFIEDSIYGRYFFTIAISNSIFGALLSCETRLLKRGLLQRVVRMASFGLPFLYDNIPVVMRQIYCTPETCQDYIESQPYYILHFICGVSSAIVYLSHLPERLTDRFDLCGYSHHIFHALGGFSIYFQVQGLLIDFNARADLTISENPKLFETAIGIFFIICAVNSCIVMLKLRMMYDVLHPPDSDKCAGCCIHDNKHRIYDVHTADSDRLAPCCTNGHTYISTNNNLCDQDARKKVS